MPKEEDTNKRIISKQASPIIDIATVTNKMQKQEKLTEGDYKCICDFLINNNDESKSEEAGYVLFEYLRGNQLRNSAFASYLNKKDVSYRERVFNNLIQIMCIDLGEENYSYDAFVKDFSLFRNNVSAKKIFDQCMSNQVE